MNPLCKLNPHYFDSINNAGRPSHYELTYTTAIANQARLTEPSNNEINLNRLFFIFVNFANHNNVRK